MESAKFLHSRTRITFHTINYVLAVLSCNLEIGNRDLFSEKEIFRSRKNCSGN